jgi:hypothetical protein
LYLRRFALSRFRATKKFADLPLRPVARPSTKVHARGRLSPTLTLRGGARLRHLDRRLGGLVGSDSRSVLMKIKTNVKSGARQVEVPA